MFLSTLGGPINEVQFHLCGCSTYVGGPISEGTNKSINRFRRVDCHTFHKLLFSACCIDSCSNSENIYTKVCIHRESNDI